MTNHDQKYGFDVSLRRVPRAAHGAAVLLLTAMLSIAGSAPHNGGANKVAAGNQHGQPTALTGPEYVAAQEALADYIAAGRPFTYETGTLACQGAKVNFTITDPLTVEVDGHQLDGYLMVNNSARGFSVELLDPQAPGAPVISGLPACELVTNTADPNPTGTIHLAALALPGQISEQKGGPFELVDPANGQVISNIAGDPADIALWSIAQK